MGTVRQDNGQVSLGAGYNVIIGQDVTLTGNEDTTAADRAVAGHSPEGHLPRDGADHGHNRRADFLDCLCDCGIDLGGINHQCGAWILRLGLAFAASG